MTDIFLESVLIEYQLRKTEASRVSASQYSASVLTTQEQYDLEHRPITGIIDPDYTGEIKILLLNLGTEPFQILTGNAIAQLILEKISMPILHKVNTLPPTTRGDRSMLKSNTL